MAAWRRSRQEVFVPLIYRPGELAEVDFFAVEAIVGGRRVSDWLFTLRLMYSGRDFTWLYPWADQTSFLDGHVRAFEHFGGVPERIAYDNLKAKVAQGAGGQRTGACPPVCGAGRPLRLESHALPASTRAMTRAAWRPAAKGSAAST
jgi:hypothetical protein